MGFPAPECLIVSPHMTQVEGFNPDRVFQASGATLGSVLRDHQGDRSNFHFGCSRDRLRWPGRTVWAHVHSGLTKTRISPEDTSPSCSLASGRLLQASLQTPRCTPRKSLVVWGLGQRAARADCVAVSRCSWSLGLEHG